MVTLTVQIGGLDARGIASELRCFVHDYKFSSTDTHAVAALDDERVGLVCWKCLSAGKAAYVEKASELVRAADQRVYISQNRNVSPEGRKQKTLEATVLRELAAGKATLSTTEVDAQLAGADPQNLTVRRIEQLKKSW